MALGIVLSEARRKLGKNLGQNRHDDGRNYSR
jgi:hypothetical protein